MNDFPGSRSEDERMRELLNDAVSDIEPQDSLDSIRSRTVVTPFRSRRPWILGAGAAVVATAATVAAVAVMGSNPGTTTAPDPGFANGGPTASATGDPSPDGGPSREDSPSPDEQETAAPPIPSDPTTNVDGGPTAGEAVTVPVYYVGDTSRGPRLFREFHSVTSSSDLAATAATRAVSASPIDPDYRESWPTGSTVDSVTHDGGVITVDLAHTSGSPDELRDRPENMEAAEASAAVEQVIYTVQAALQSRDPVQFLINGARTDMVLGVPASEPLSQGATADVLAGIWVISPSEGEEVKSGSTVSGVAEGAFEANVQWELVQDGRVVESGFTTAGDCCSRAEFSFELPAAPGEYTLVVHDTDPSGGEGFAPWEDTKNIVVTE